MALTWKPLLTLAITNWLVWKAYVFRPNTGCLTFFWLEAAYATMFAALWWTQPSEDEPTRGQRAVVWAKNLYEERGARMKLLAPSTDDEETPQPATFETAPKLQPPVARPPSQPPAVRKPVFMTSSQPLVDDDDDIPMDADEAKLNAMAQDLIKGWATYIRLGGTPPSKSWRLNSQPNTQSAAVASPQPPKPTPQPKPEPIEARAEIVQDYEGDDGHKPESVMQLPASRKPAVLMLPPPKPKKRRASTRRPTSAKKK